MPMMRRRPLLRAAAVGGGAYMAGKHRANTQAREAGQEERIEDLEAQPAPPPAYAAPAPAPAPAAAGPSDDAIAKLTQLGQLHEQGVLTDEEFARQKSLLLG
jgi:putative oligomerization/nucleic acid binding protein